MPLYLALIFAFAGIGLMDTIYLTSHVITKKPVKCLFFPEEWCRKVQYSNYSKTFGVPNAVAGLGMYILIILLTWLFVAGVLPFWPAATIITIGFLFSLYFTFIQAAILHAFCTWCVVSAINFFIMAAAVYLIR